MTPLRQRMLDDMRLRNFSPHTQDSYLLQIAQFARYFAKSPEVLGPDEIRTYQLYLATEKKLAPGSLHVTASALRFLYKVTLKQPWDVEDLPSPKKPQTLPDRVESRGSHALPRVHPHVETAHHPHRLLCGGLAHCGSDPSENHRHR